jgi:Ca2+-binding EF-hand superfamily protein
MIENYLITNMSYFLAKGNPEKKLKWAFKMYDIDSNGSVDRQEMLKIIEVKLNSLNTKKIIFFSL